MADITIVNTTHSSPAAIDGGQKPASQKLASQEPAQGSVQKPAAEPAEPYFDLIELLFFAYRDFVGDPDEVLEKLGFGRAHHRVLHFVNRNPGMKVAELLDVLKITKQSLGRVLKQLIDEGYVVQKAGANDRRQRLLFASPAGEALAMKLAGLQALRIKRVLADLGPDTREAARRFLAGMIDAADRERVLHMIARADSFSGCADGRPHAHGQNDVPQNLVPQDLRPQGEVS
jgi:DNA-binding MarR family transcriptional regulator